MKPPATVPNIPQPMTSRTVRPREMRAMNRPMNGPYPAQNRA